MSTTRPASPKAPATNGLPRGAALLVCTHGTHGAVGAAGQHADVLRRRQVAAEVGACCLKGHPGVGDALAGLSSTTVVLVPLLMADGYAARTLLPRALAEAADDRHRVFLCPPVGLHAGLADIILARGLHRCRQRGWVAAETALVLVGHGTRRNLASTGTAYRQAASVRRSRAFADVAVAFLEAPPLLPDALARLGDRNAVVIGFFADRGMHGEADVPRLLEPFAKVAAYDGPIGIVPEIAEIILAQAEFAASPEPPPVPLPPHEPRLRQRILLAGGPAGQLQGDGGGADDGGLGPRRAEVAAP